MARKINLAHVNLLYLSALALVLISTTTLTLVVNKKSKVVEKVSSMLGASESYPALPTLNTDLVNFPVFSAQSVLALDLNSGVTLYEKNPDAAVLPASTTKIVTALVTLDYYDINSILTVSEINVEGQKMGLVTGEEMTVKDLLYGLLVYSANDAAEVLAKNYCQDGNCGKEFFVSAMNKKAYQLGLTNTNFTNPVGLDNPSHYSTARDLVKVSVEAMKNPLFARIVGTKETSVTSTDGRIVHKLTNINALLGTVEGVKGVKTGWTAGARENLVTYVERDNKKILIALLGSQDRFGETKELINWIFDNYEWKDVTYLP